MISIIDEVQKITTKKNNEWYTPSKYIEAARAVMQGIDLDPASCELANRTVKATRYYTKEDNGLAQEWHGRVWLNPPYGANNHLPNDQKSYVKQWVDKLICSHNNGDVEQAIACLLIQPSAKWFSPLWNYPLCFTNHNVRFFLPNKSTAKGRKGRTTDSHLFGTLFVYLGPNISSFVEHFTEFGPVITPDGVHRRPAPIPQPTLWDKEITS